MKRLFYLLLALLLWGCSDESVTNDAVSLMTVPAANIKVVTIVGSDTKIQHNLDSLGRIIQTNKIDQYEMVFAQEEFTYDSNNRIKKVISTDFNQSMMSQEEVYDYSNNTITASSSDDRQRSYQRESTDNSTTSKLIETDNAGNTVTSFHPLSN